MIKNILIYYMAKRKHKKKYKDEEDDDDDKKYKINDAKNILSIVFHFLKLIILLIIFMYISASLVFLVKEMPVNNLNDLFPTKCDDLPYGNSEKNPCMKTGLEDIISNEKENIYETFKKYYKFWLSLISSLSFNPFKKQFEKGEEESAEKFGIPESDINLNNESTKGGNPFPIPFKKEFVTGEKKAANEFGVEFDEENTTGSSNIIKKIFRLLFGKEFDKGEIKADQKFGSLTGGGLTDKDRQEKYYNQFTGCDTTDDCFKCSTDNKDPNCKNETFECKKNKNKISMPWRFYSPKLSKSIFSILNRYKDFLISSFAKTEIGLNWHLKSIICKIRNQPLIPCSFLLIISLIIFKILYMVGMVYYLIKLIVTQCSSIFDYGWWGVLILFCFWILAIILSIIWFKISFIFLFFKSLFGSFFKKENRDSIHQIVYNNKMLIGYLLGAVFLSTINHIKMDKSYGRPIKLVLLITYLLILFMHVIRYIPGVIFKAVVALFSCLF